MPARSQRPGVVIADAIYTLPEIKDRLNWSDSALREARRKGLLVHRSGKHGFVDGRDLIDFLTQRKEVRDK